MTLKPRHLLLVFAEGIALVLLLRWDLFLEIWK